MKKIFVLSIVCLLVLSGSVLLTTEDSSSVGLYSCKIHFKKDARVDKFSSGYLTVNCSDIEIDEWGMVRVSSLRGPSYHIPKESIAYISE